MVKVGKKDSSKVETSPSGPLDDSSDELGPSPRQRLFSTAILLFPPIYTILKKISFSVWKRDFLKYCNSKMAVENKRCRGDGPSSSLLSSSGSEGERLSKKLCISIPVQ